MTASTSHYKCSLVLNGARIQGFADDDPPVEVPQIELITTKYGQDGTMYAHYTERQGGEVIVKLLPTSPDAQRFLRWHAEIQSGHRILFSGQYGDPALNFSMFMRGGVLGKCPPTIIPNQTFEVSLMFEELRPSYDGARFAPTPATGSTSRVEGSTTSFGAEFNIGGFGFGFSGSDEGAQATLGPVSFGIDF